MKKILIILLCVISIIFIGCDRGIVNYYYQFKDDLGNTINLKDKPKKVACLFSSFAEVWILAGGEVAITVYETIERNICNDAILVDNGAGKTINNELLILSEPDFVICSADISNQLKTAELLNKAMNETLSRTVLTSLTTVLSLFALCIFGGKVIFDFCFPILFGLMFGTFSSICLSAPLLLTTGIKVDGKDLKIGL